MRDYIDGPGLMKWLRDMHILADEVNVYGESWARRLYSWREGAAPYYTTVDRFGCEIGFTLTELPDDLWLERRPTRTLPGRRIPLEVKQHALALYEKYGSAVRAAQEAGVSTRSVSDWAKGQKL